MLLNWSASASSSSPVWTAMRSLRSPAPIFAAPAWSAPIGRTMRRARTRLARNDSTTPNSSSNAVRCIDARRGSNASSSGCSTKTDHRSEGMVANAVRTRRFLKSRAIACSSPSPPGPGGPLIAAWTWGSDENAVFWRTRLMSGWASRLPLPSTA